MASVTWVFFMYGIVRFYDGPIHPCAEHGYCGKQGQPHTRADYDAEMWWETRSECAIAAIAIYGILVAFTGRRRI